MKTDSKRKVDWPDRLRRLRRRREIDIDACAEALGVTSLEVLELEAGKRRFKAAIRKAVEKMEKTFPKILYARALRRGFSGQIDGEGRRKKGKQNPFNHAAYLKLLFEIAECRLNRSWRTTDDDDDDGFEMDWTGRRRHGHQSPIYQRRLVRLEKTLEEWRREHGDEIAGFPFEAKCWELGLSVAERWILVGLMKVDKGMYEGRGTQDVRDLLRVAVDDLDDVLRQRSLLLGRSPLLRSGLVKPIKETGGGFFSLFGRGRDGFLDRDFTLTEEGRKRLFGDLLKESIDPEEKARQARVETPAYGLDAVILPPEHRRRLEEVLVQARRGDVFFEKWGLAKTIHYGRGLLLLFQGPPGTGKTMAAGALAKELGKKLLVADFGKIEGMYVGETEKNIADLFQEAKEKGAVLFIDEADGLIATREMAQRGWEIRHVNVLLQELERSEGVVVLATNHASVLDPALESRCALRLEFPMPGPAERERIFRAHLPPEYPLAPDVDLADLSRRHALCGRSIKNVVLAAARRALSAGRERVTDEDLESACKDETGGKAEARPLGFAGRP